MEMLKNLETIRSCQNSYWSSRVAAELLYAVNLSAVHGHCYDALIDEAAEQLVGAIHRDGVITDDAARATEEKLLPLSADAKKYKIRCVAHAHIDMNWMWGFQETVTVTIDTFRTILELMREYPEMTFAQSQASTYRIIEEYAPELLPEIRERVAEGRWEVTASAWVEADKNMTGAESLARPIRYSKRYLTRLLDIAPDSIRIDFEPDTFGHNITMPEILADGGVKYLYHCRGYNGHYLYTWRARSGKSVLVYREPKWYNAEIVPDMLSDVPLFCDSHGVDVMLKVYGVGDHGGGPTRRDIERILDVMQWPIQPTVTFGTFDAFFAELEKFQPQLPVVEQELNYIFTGCYTSQARIKAANRIAEARVYDAEVLDTASAVLEHTDRKQQLNEAWEKILFNHFHDILPGSGVEQTREYALGTFQQAMAGIGAVGNLAMRSIAAGINTEAISVAEDTATVSEGAGVGFGSNADTGYVFHAAERGLGRKRIFHLFNTTQYDYDGVAQLIAWDWNYHADRITVAAPDGTVLPHKLLAAGSGYWEHRYTAVAAHVRIPAFGYTTVTMDEAAPASPVFASTHDPRLEYFPSERIVLENTRIRAEFDRQTMLLFSLVHKASGRELIDDPSAMFRYITEASVGMTSWREGSPMRVECLNESGRVRVTEESLGGIRKWIRFEIPFGSASCLRATVSLDENSSVLEFDTVADFREVGGGGKIPQLSFLAPLAYTPLAYRCDVPYGTIDRPDAAHDVPGMSFIAAVPEDGAAAFLVTDSKYGYRGHENAIGVNLIRASYDPDPIPDFGPQRIRLGLGVLDDAAPATLLAASDHFNHPASTVSVRRGAGRLPMQGSFLTVAGGIRLTAVKTPEDGEGILVRFSDITGKGGEYALTFAFDIAEAVYVDTNENALTPAVFEGRTVRGRIDPYAIEAIRVHLK